MKNTKKNLVSTLITSGLVGLTALGLCIGGSVAFFQSNATVDATITSAQVNYSMAIDSSSLKTKSYGKDYEDGGKHFFANSNSSDTTSGASIEDNSLTITNMAPGDSVQVAFKVRNKSTIPTKYKFHYSLEENIDNGPIPDFLNYSIVDDNTTQNSEEWVNQEATGSATGKNWNITVTITYPEDCTEVLTEDCLIHFYLDAIQGNAPASVITPNHLLDQTNTTDYISYDASTNTYTLLKDLILLGGDCIQISSDANIDFNNHTIQSTGYVEYSNQVYIGKDAQVTMKNGAWYFNPPSTDDEQYSAFYVAGYNASPITYAKLSTENMTFEFEGKGFDGFEVGARSSLTMKGCTVKSGHIAFSQWNGRLDIQSSHIYASYADFFHEDDCSFNFLTITDCDIHITPSSDYKDSAAFLLKTKSDGNNTHIYGNTTVEFPSHGFVQRGGFLTIGGDKKASLTMKKTADVLDSTTEAEREKGQSWDDDLQIPEGYFFISGQSFTVNDNASVTFQSGSNVKNAEKFTAAISDTNFKDITITTNSKFPNEKVRVYDFRTKEGKKLTIDGNEIATSNPSAERATTPRRFYYSLADGHAITEITDTTTSSTAYLPSVRKEDR